MIIDPYVWMKTPILAIRRVATDTVVIRVAKPDNYGFTPGQYAIVRAEVDGVGLIRQYSFISLPGDTHLEFLIRRLPLGSVSSWLCDRARVGDWLQITKPYGQFRRDTGRPAIFIAAGVGIAPFISMLKAENHDTFTLYTERSQDRVCSDESIDDAFTGDYLVHLSGIHGRINSIQLQRAMRDNAMYYLCGSKQFVDQIENALEMLSVKKEDIRREAFTLD